jgi:hypothetical protein
MHHSENKMSTYNKHRHVYQCVFGVAICCKPSVTCRAEVIMETFDKAFEVAVVSPLFFFLRYCDPILYASLTSFFFICLSFLIFFQPSLHKPSIMAHRVRILHNPQQKTVRMHYASKFFFSSCYSDF